MSTLFGRPIVFVEDFQNDPRPIDNRTRPQPIPLTPEQMERNRLQREENERAEREERARREAVEDQELALLIAFMRLAGAGVPR